MKTIQVKSNFGNFDWTAVTEVTEQVADVLANFGGLQILQRSPSTGAEKKLGGYDKKRPDGFKRTDIAYSAENAAVLQKFLEGATVEIDDKDVKLGFVVEVTEHVGTVADVKMTEERAAYERNSTKLAALASRVGYSGDVGDGNKANAPIEFLRAIRKWSQEMVKGL